MAYYTTASATSSNCTIWNNWCSNARTAAAVYNGSNGTVWMQWVGTTTSNATSLNSGVWIQNVRVTPAPEITPAQAAEWKRKAEENAKRADEERKKRIAAERRALRLLKKLLTSEQLRDYERKGHFHVIGKSGQRYRIRKNSYAGNIDVIGADGKVQKRICCHADGHLIPLPDHLLTQKLALERNEEAFLKVANISAA